ncbi:MAG: RtcB family protein [Thermoguttaceae bacterium]
MNVKIFAKTIETEAERQVQMMAESPIGRDANIRIMPDAHAGIGCVIGTTMRIDDKVCPNLVGVDIGCGVNLVKTDTDFSRRLEELDATIRNKVPFGNRSHDRVQEVFDFTQLHCWGDLGRKTQDLAWRAGGTLGGGNHFIEAYANGFLAVHSGSRNIGYRVAEHYQRLAEKECDYSTRELRYLTGERMQSYLHDASVMQAFAERNRETMLRAICRKMGASVTETIVSTHNYIDVEQMILRKGAISAKLGERLVIPLNMRDGLLIAVGKGNADWNFSAPHGAGRLYSRTKAKNSFTLTQYRDSMAGIFSSCINRDTIDEAPFVYKDWQEISECIEPTVSIETRLVPIFNFKASE